MEWKRIRLGDYISIKSGLAYSGSKIGKGESILLGMGCVSFKDKFVESGARPYDDICDDRFVVKPGDIVLATRQQSDNLPILAMPAIIPQSYQGKRVIFGTNLYKVENKSEISNRFLFWLFKHQHYVNYIAGIKSGTAVQMVTKKNVEDYKFLCPPANVRYSISSILWTYDNLIENNTRRIRLLEQMAENLYKEWFVRFRFPGHEKAEFENGLPKDWTIKKLGDFITFERGVGYGSKDIEDGENVLLSMNNIRPYGGFIRDYSRPYSGKYKEFQKVKKGDLIMSITDMTQDRRIIGYTGIVPPGKDNRIICTHLVKLSSEISHTYFLNGLFNYSNLSRIIAERATGANVLGLTADILKGVKTLLPPKQLQSMYVTKVTPIIEECFSLQDANDNLARQRDLLLPRLMSGKLEVNV